MTESDSRPRPPAKPRELYLRSRMMLLKARMRDAFEARNLEEHTRLLEEFRTCTFRLLAMRYEEAG